MPAPGSSAAELSPLTLDSIDVLFAPEDREQAQALLRSADFRESERCRMAALKFSDGNLAKLERAVELGKRDYRDLLMAVGFGRDVSAHLSWKPKPAGEPSEIEPGRLAAGIHERIRASLSPLGFERRGEEWRREREVGQVLCLVTGLTSRVETRFFLRLTLESRPTSVLLQLPRLPTGPARFSAEQGYIFRSGGDEGVFYDAVVADLAQYVKPWFERFTTSFEVRRGFEDQTFHPHIRMKNQAIVF